MSNSVNSINSVSQLLSAFLENLKMAPKTQFLIMELFFVSLYCTFVAFMISTSSFCGCVIVTVWHVDRAESRSQWSSRQGSGCTIKRIPIWRGWPYPVYSLATGQPQTYWRLPRIKPTTHWDKLPSLESRRCNKLNKEESLIRWYQMKV